VLTAIIFTVSQNSVKTNWLLERSTRVCWSQKTGRRSKYPLKHLGWALYTNKDRMWWKHVRNSWCFPPWRSNIVESKENINDTSRTSGSYLLCVRLTHILRLLFCTRVRSCCSEVDQYVQASQWQKTLVSIAVVCSKLFQLFAMCEYVLVTLSGYFTK